MEIIDVEENLNAQLTKDFAGQRDGFVQVGEKKWFYPTRYRETIEKIKKFEVRPDDIWITGFPRSGTSLTEELVWLLSHGMDTETAKKVPQDKRVKFFEFDMVIHPSIEKEFIERFPEESERFGRYRKNIENLKEAKDRRVIKTHLPFELLPEDIIKKGCKVIYVCRNPKDVCASFYFLQANNFNMKFQGDFKKYWNYFRNGYCTFGPYFEHVKQGFNRIGSENFTFAFFEEFRKDPEAYIRKIANSLEISISEEEMEKISEFIDINNYRKITTFKIRSSNNEKTDFIRKGKVGGGSDYFTEELEKEADEWIKVNTENIGIKYPQKDD